jgi:hypothetical protein
MNLPRSVRPPGLAIWCTKHCREMAAVRAQIGRCDCDRDEGSSGRAKKITTGWHFLLGNSQDGLSTRNLLDIDPLQILSYGAGRRPNAFLHYTSEWILRFLLSSSFLIRGKHNKYSFYTITITLSYSRESEQFGWVGEANLRIHSLV